jgi:hypothetical protein
MISLRAVARIALVVGAVGSVALMLRAGTNTPRFLLVIFVFWILSPFVALAWANTVAPRWTALTRMTLYVVTIALAPASLAIYSGLIPRPAGSANAVLFTAGPVASWVVMTVAVGIAALVARGRSAT